MRRMLALVAVMVLVQFAAGCRHVAGGCDCDHTTGGGGGCGGCSAANVAPAAPTLLPASPTPAPTPAPVAK